MSRQVSFDPKIAMAGTIAAAVESEPEQTGLVRTDATPPSLGSTKIKELDGLRGLAISFVLISHLSFPTPSVERIVTNGWVGVDLFFVLSGFLITGILLRQREAPHYYKNFYARRTLRIFPAYYMVLIAAVSGALLVGSDYESLRQWGSPWWFVFFLGNFRQAVVPFWPKPIYFAQLWSLQVEEQFYLVYPFFVRNLSTRGLSKLLVAVVLVALAVRSWIVWWGHANLLLPFVLTICRADSLAIGAFVAVYLRNRRLPKPGRCMDAVVVLGFALLLTLHCDPYSAFFRSVGYTLVAAFFAIVLLWTLSHMGEPATAILRRGPLPWLGVISYGLYLWFQFAYLRLGFEFNSVVLDTLIQFAKPAGAIVLGLASFHFIEKPYLKRKEQFQ
jgi:peptidoglycan/LPS O-acetylase OafA/YrhL